MNGDEDVIIKIGTEYTGSSGIMGKLGLEQSLPAINAAKASFKDVSEVIDKSTSSANRFGAGSFRAASAFLFFGAVLERTLMSAARNSVSTFNDITHSVYMAYTQSDLLNNSFTYLGFVIGQALDPLLGKLIPIIEAMSNWVAQNQTATQVIVIILGVISTLLITLGALTIATKASASMFETLGTMMGYSTVQITAAKTATLEFMATWIPLVLIVAGIAILIAYLVKFTTAVGGIGETFKAVLRGILLVNALIYGAFAALGAGITEVMQMAWNALLTGIQWIVNKIITGVEYAINAIRELAQKDPIKLPRLDLTAIKADTQDLKTTMLNAFGDIMQSYEDVVSTGVLAPSQGFSNSTNLIPTYSATGSTGAASSSNSTSNQLNVQQMVIQQPDNSSTNAFMQQVLTTAQSTGYMPTPTTSQR